MNQSPLFGDLLKQALGKQQPVQKPQGTVQVGKFNVTPRLAGMLGLQEAEEKQSRQQMSHTQSSTQGVKPERGFTKEDFNLTGGIMQQPLQETVQRAIPTINEDMITEEATNLGMAGLAYGQTIFRGVLDPVAGKVSRRMEQPEYEFGTHVSIDPDTAQMFARSTGTDDYLKAYSNVKNPLWVSDGEWTVDRLVERLINEHDDLAKALETKLLKERTAYIKEKDNTIADKEAMAKLDNKYAKRLQAVLKKAGYDHISYINKREGRPVESAILFDTGSHTRTTVVKGQKRETKEGELEFPPDMVKIDWK